MQSGEPAVESATHVIVALHPGTGPMAPILETAHARSFVAAGLGRCPIHGEWPGEASKDPVVVGGNPWKQAARQDQGPIPSFRPIAPAGWRLAVFENPSPPHQHGDTIQPGWAARSIASSYPTTLYLSSTSNSALIEACTRGTASTMSWGRFLGTR